METKPEKSTLLKFIQDKYNGFAWTHKPLENLIRFDSYDNAMDVKDLLEAGGLTESIEVRGSEGKMPCLNIKWRYGAFK